MKAALWRPILVKWTAGMSRLEHDSSQMRQRISQGPRALKRNSCFATSIRFSNCSYRNRE